MECSGDLCSAAFEGCVRAGREIPDVICLCDRRPGRRRGFHDVTIVNMEDLAEPVVSEADLSLLRRQWPVTAVQSMTYM